MACGDRRVAIGPRYPGVLSDDGSVVLFTHPGDAQWTEVVVVEQLDEVEKDPPPVAVVFPSFTEVFNGNSRAVVAEFFTGFPGRY